MGRNAKDILLIDDDRAFLKKAIRLLAFNGLSAASCSDPARALERWRCGRYRIVVTDYCMPGLNGLEVLSRLRSLDREVKTILLTGLEDEAVREAALAAGACAFIRKPLDLQEFVGALSGLLGQGTGRETQTDAVERLSPRNLEGPCRGNGPGQEGL
ncbi:response regulator [bacterium]|nr:response regulator [bacterium]